MAKHWNLPAFMHSDGSAAAETTAEQLVRGVAPATYSEAAADWQRSCSWSSSAALLGARAGVAPARIAEVVAAGAARVAEPRKPEATSSGLHGATTPAHTSCWRRWQPHRCVLHAAGRQCNGTCYSIRPARTY
ncbi:hypothetical protein TRIUR3_01749 [Triticum urartu]|uniref:Uncharacterized protein n=1 Tax=Triticum urartu TaxID=4572 RepID=M7ZDT1_TRIUA|nr:hypothetical protein TRIUR3_01749 [Triticum urartu]